MQEIFYAMKKSLLFSIILISLVNTILANHFFIDPINGDINNDGSINHPWSTFEEVIANNYIESYTNTLPYNESTNKLIIKNENAPVHAGDTLYLLTGLHGDIKLVNYNNIKNIVVMAYNSQYPVLKRLHLVACKNWVFSSLSISSEPYGYYITDRLVYLESHGWQGPSSNIDIVDCNIYSAVEPWTKAEDWREKVSDGIHIRCDSVNIVNNTLRNINFGIRAAGDHINAINNEIVNFSADGMRLQGSYNLFEANLIKNCYKIDENHDDGIQSFTTNGVTVDNNIIRSNIITNYEDENQALLGDLQGIGCFDGFYHNWVIENNLIITNHWHGITLLGADSCVIVNNTVLDPSPDKTPGGSWIMIDNHKDGRPSTNCVVANNVANSLNAKGFEINNVVFNSYKEYSDNFVEYANNNFHLKKESILIDKADAKYAPEKDIENTNRNIGIAPDIGAYEYVFPDFTDTPEKSKVSIYPNPAKDYVTIENENAGFTLTIFDSMGNRKLSKNIKSKSISFNIKHLGVGLYYIEISNRKEKSIFIKKIVVIE